MHLRAPTMAKLVQLGQVGVPVNKEAESELFSASGSCPWRTAFERGPKGGRLGREPIYINI